MDSEQPTTSTTINTVLDMVQRLRRRLPRPGRTIATITAIPSPTRLSIIMTGLLIGVPGSVAAQEGISNAADVFCEGQVASLASLGFYSLALGSVIGGMYYIFLPKADNNMSQRGARSSKRRGIVMIALGICAGAIPGILAGAGLVDVTTCINPDNI